MNRRESLKALGITTISTGILLDACKTEEGKSSSIAKTDPETPAWMGYRNLKKND